VSSFTVLRYTRHVYDLIGPQVALFALSRKPITTPFPRLPFPYIKVCILVTLSLLYPIAKTQLPYMKLNMQIPTQNKISMTVKPVNIPIRREVRSVAYHTQPDHVSISYLCIEPRFTPIFISFASHFLHSAFVTLSCEQRIFQALPNRRHISRY
jgi:hypothetical protein